MGSELITASHQPLQPASKPRRQRQTPLAVILAGVLLSAWLIVQPRTPDLAAQVYRVSLFGQDGFSLWDNRWYAGHHLLGYSLLFPALASTIGIRILATLSVLASSVLFERIVWRSFGAAGRWGAVWFALAAAGDVWIGRLTFVLGVTLALAALLLLLHGRRAAGALLAALATAASPLAAVLLAFALASHALLRRQLSPQLWLIAPVLAIAGALALLFPEGGFEPFPVRSFVATVAVTLAFLWALPASARLLRGAALLYLAACLASLLIHTPMGSNIERYGVLLAGALLLCELGRDSVKPRALVALAMIALWTLWGPVRELTAVSGSASTTASYYTPVMRFIEHHGGSRIRVEVPLTRSHWEAALLAPHVMLARGWDKQLDERYNSALLSKSLSARSYRRWLEDEAISYVALPDTRLDPSSSREGALIGSGLHYLRLAAVSRHWRIYHVLNATPLLSGQGHLTALSSDSFTVNVDGKSRVLLRVHYTPYWTITAGDGCVSGTLGGWTLLTSSRAGTITVAARFSLAALITRQRCA